MDDQQRDLEEARILQEEEAAGDDFDEDVRDNQEEHAAPDRRVEAESREQNNNNNLRVDFFEGVHYLDGNNDDQDDEGEEEVPRFPDVLPDRVLAVNDPHRMQITATERQRALAIKRAISHDPEIDPVSDFTCAQMALIVEDDIESALERLLQMQGFREEYDIRDTVAEAVQTMARYLSLMPGAHLSFAFNYEDGNYVIIYDNDKMDCDIIQQQESNIRTSLAGSYYTCKALCPDLEAVRKGAVLIIECEGYDWKKGWDIKLLKRIWSEIGGVFPVTWHKLKYFNNGFAMNVLVSMLKPFLPTHALSKMDYGCKFEQRLDKLYLIPNVEAANLRLLRGMEDSLIWRCHNEKTFKL